MIAAPTLALACPLPATSDRPFSWKALAVWNAYAAVVLRGDDAAHPATPVPQEETPVPDFAAAVTVSRPSRTPHPKRAPRPSSWRPDYNLQKSLSSDVAARTREVERLMAAGKSQSAACKAAGMAPGHFARAARSLAAGFFEKPAVDPEELRRFRTRLYMRWRHRKGQPEWALVGPPRIRDGRLVLNPALITLLRDDERRGLFPAKAVAS